jgi:hypothetical protein
MPETRLDPATYWRLRTLTAERDLAQAHAQLAEARYEAARARWHAAWTETAAQYGLATDRQYALVDAACSVVEPAESVS